MLRRMRAWRCRGRRWIAIGQSITLPSRIVLTSEQARAAAAQPTASRRSNMAFTADYRKFLFPERAFAGKRVLITGSGKDGGIGQGLALAAAANGAAVVGVHFHSSYRDGFDMVDAMRAQGVKAFAMQADVTNTRDLWASRSYVIEQMEGKGPDIVICNSGLTEKGYRYGRALPEIEGESRAERRARVRREFIENLAESKLVMDTKIDGFVYMTHLWAGEAVYHNQPVQFVYISSMQSIQPGVAVPGYVVANWAILRLPEVLRVNLGKAANMATSCCLMLPFIRTGMTEEYADNPKVFGRWQPRMLETHEAAQAVSQLLSRPAEELNLGNYKLGVEGSAEAIKLKWSQIKLEVSDQPLPWSP
jgi:NAD(P)-dependent dehydrogenase (short-subunit alcohol dehydrogenase family)